MSTGIHTRRLVFLAPLVIGLVGALLLLAGSRGVEANDPVLRATSVCEAHELKARKAEDPDLEIEIPPEFDTPWPSAEACSSHVESWNPDTPGPLQPIPFSHLHHAGRYEIECNYCHTATDRSPAAGVPSVELCMGCHQNFPASYDELEGIRILKEHWGIAFEQDENGQWKSQPRDPEKAKPIEWVQIHRLPEHVQFRHNRHIAAGVECQRCHGEIEAMEKVYLTEDEVWWPWLTPASKLEMGWCINCHRENNASQDCYRCHY